MLKKYIDVAAGRVKADIVLKNAAFLNTFTGKVEEGDIAIAGDRIAGIGSYEGQTEYDFSGLVVTPGLIDSHVHIESSMLPPEDYASLVVPRGTTAVVADPHEIVNVCGMAGFDYMVGAARRTPLDVRFQLPSCVPATPFETSGACLSGEHIAGAMRDDSVFGLGEMMNFPGVVDAECDTLIKLEAAHACGKTVDGHAPCVTGSRLNAYICGGISTDHESSSPAEIAEKLSRGMYIMLRHSSSGGDLVSNSRAVNAGNVRRFLLCTDDRHAADIRDEGHIDDALRRLVAGGLDAAYAVTMATLNAAECYGMKWNGAVAPYYFADLVAFDDLKRFNAKYVFVKGRLTALNGALLLPCRCGVLPQSVLNTVMVRDMCAADFVLPAEGRVRAVTATPGSLITGCDVISVHSHGGDISLPEDVLKLTVIERHGKNGNIGRGLLKGYGFKGGAMGITVAHDSHNMIILGDDNAAMAAVANHLRDMGGGMALAKRGGEVEGMALDIAGLMSSRGADYVVGRSSALYAAARKMGVKQGFAPFMTLAFLSLAVIPHLKLLDTGLFDVDKFAFTHLKAD